VTKEEDPMGIDLRRLAEERDRLTGGDVDLVARGDVAERPGRWTLKRPVTGPGYRGYRRRARQVGLALVAQRTKRSDKSAGVARLMIVDISDAALRFANRSR
jgi:hypothetical protein